MTVVEVEQHGLDLAKSAAGVVRSPGLHASDLYNALYARIDPKRYASTGPPPATRMGLGLAFEEILEGALVERLLGERPPEQLTSHEDDCPHVGTPGVCACGAGVAYSPDFIFYELREDGEPVLGEMKCTWYSMRDAPRDKKFDKWHCQMRTYCYHLGTPFARLLVLFVNGDYKPPTPVFRVWDITYTPRELRDNWRQLVRQGQRMGVFQI